MNVRGQRTEGGGLQSGMLVIVGIALLWLAGQHNPRLASMRTSPSPTSHFPPSTVHVSLPPVVSFATVVLGGFRGLVADLLWLRAADLQEAGRYFELVQLADWITMLEPQFSDVWTLHAWNMAYNISVMVPGDEDRWRWVQNAIRLIRDRGLRYNPNDSELYFELGALFLHKIGADIDSSAPYYKRQWAKQMMALFGESGRPDHAAIAADPAALARLQAYGLDPRQMRELDSHYGPLDWRVAETHALYWARLGTLAAAPGSPSPACARMVCQSMAALFEHGRLTYSAAGDLFVTSPEFDLLPNVLATFEETVARASDSRPAGAYAGFLASAIKVLKFYHYNKEARELFTLLHDRFPSPATQRGFEAFARGGMPLLPEILAAPGEE